MTTAPAPIFLDRSAIETVLPPRAARAAIAAMAAGGLADAPPRWSVPFGTGELLLMPAVARHFSGVKVITLPDPAHPTVRRAPGVQGVYVLFDQQTLAPAALFDAAALTEVRTAAVSAFVADRLLPPGDIVAMVFGAGAQARAHLLALAATRPLAEALVVARRDDAARALLDFAAAHGIAARAATADEVDRAGVVCCCTASAEPLFDGSRLVPGTHVTAIGSHHPARREVDTTTVRRSFVVVESRDSAAAEAGDLLIPLAEGAVATLPIDADLAELAAGAPTDGVRDLTLFKSVGVAPADLAIAEAVLGALDDEAPLSGEKTPRPSAP